jgi:phosphate:Na+ symporter
LNQELLSLLGGSALFVYSTGELSKGAQYLAGSQLRSWLNKFTDNRLYAVLFGVIMAGLFSSSGSVTVMLVGLANARLLSLEQILPVTLGAAIGSTLIVHLLAFNISQYGLLLVGLGVGAEALLTSEKWARTAHIVFALGLMFFSLSLVVGSGEALQQNTLFRYIIDYFRDRPAVSLLLSFLLTTVAHSSAATVAFVMSMMVADRGTIYQALPWVLGANLGTTTVAFSASFRASVFGKQAAMANLLCRLAGVLICYPLMTYCGQFIESLGVDISRQIAWAHTFFNVGITLLFLPLMSWGAKIVRFLVPEATESGPFTFQYLDSRMLGTPELALAQAQREILRLSDTVERMVEKSLQLFHRHSPRELELLKSMDQLIDFLNKGIKLYLTRLPQKDMTPEQVQREFELVLRTNDLENIGDIVDKNILELVRKTMKKGYRFSEDGWLELEKFHAKVLDCLRLSTAYFNSRNPLLRAKLLETHQQIDEMTLDLSEMHVQRLHRGVRESLETTSVHLDLLGQLQRISALAINFTRLHGAPSRARSQRAKEKPASKSRAR